MGGGASRGPRGRARPRLDLFAFATRAVTVGPGALTKMVRIRSRLPAGHGTLERMRDGAPKSDVGEPVAAHESPACPRCGGPGLRPRRRTNNPFLNEQVTCADCGLQ